MPHCAHPCKRSSAVTAVPRGHQSRRDDHSCVFQYVLRACTPGDITAVVLVSIVLIMDAVDLGALNYKPDPAQRFDVGAIEEPTQCVTLRADRSIFKRVQGK